MEVHSHLADDIQFNLEACNIGCAHQLTQFDAECTFIVGFRYDLLSMLTKVNEDVSKANKCDYKQVPAPTHSLRKRVFFKKLG